MTEATFSVGGLQEGSEYEFRVTAENKAGLGQPSETSAKIVAKHPYGRFLVFESNFGCAIFFFFFFRTIHIWPKMVYQSNFSNKEC